MIGDITRNSNGYGIKAINGAEVILGSNIWFENLQTAIYISNFSTVSDTEIH
jgi:hypothetical protein